MDTFPKINGLPAFCVALCKGVGLAQNVFKIGMNAWSFWSGKYIFQAIFIWLYELYQSFKDRSWELCKDSILAFGQRLEYLSFHVGQLQATFPLNVAGRRVKFGRGSFLFELREQRQVCVPEGGPGGLLLREIKRLWWNQTTSAVSLSSVCPLLGVLSPGKKSGRDQAGLDQMKQGWMCLPTSRGLEDDKKKKKKQTMHEKLFENCKMLLLLQLWLLSMETVFMGHFL